MRPCERSVLIPHIGLGKDSAIQILIFDTTVALLCDASKTPTGHGAAYGDLGGLPSSATIWVHFL